MPAFSLRRAAYLGDISALLALPPLDGDACGGVLVGSGPDVAWHALPSGALRASAPLFAGARVHGLRLSGVVACEGGSVVHVAAHGGRRVALLRLRTTPGGAEMARGRALPAAAAWVLDVRALRADDGGEAEPADGPALLAVALSDNAVEVWCARSGVRRLRSACTVRALLYSSALLGDSVHTLRVASGTIFNDVLLWRPSPDGADVAPAARLRGHEGSVQRLLWADAAGAALCSVSDDRTARVWATAPVFAACDAAGWDPAAPCIDLPPLVSLFGHAGRVWDARFLHHPEFGPDAALPPLLATVSEDGTARLWRLPCGTQLAALTGHRGRGIWRCEAAITAAGGDAALLTGGADGGVKLWRLADWLAPRGAGGVDAGREEIALPEPRPACAPPAVKDGNSEYTRCVAVATPDLILVATNHGLLRAARLPCDDGAAAATAAAASPPPRWTAPLFATPGAAAIMCMRAAPAAAGSPDGVVARVLLGDMHGFATALDIVREADGGDDIAAIVTARWAAHPGGRTLGVFWLDCGATAPPLVATADARGALALWRLGADAADDSAVEHMAGATLAHRVMSCCAAPPADPACAAVAVVLCGDQRGNVLAWELHRNTPELQPLGAVPRAHATSAVTLAACAGAHEFLTAGGDGYLCTFVLLQQPASAASPATLALTRSGRQHLSRITAVEAALMLDDADADGGDVVPEGASSGGAAVAAGVTCDDLIIWDLRGTCELARVPIGGWRHPHGVALGPGGRFVVAHLRGGALRVRRRWPPLRVAGGADDAQRCVRPGHHGREVHDALFVPPPAGDAARGGGPAALITGSEDGMLFRVYLDAVDAATHTPAQLRAPALLAQTAGGTAVRALALLPLCGDEFILLSAGAKEVLMAWHLRWQPAAPGAHPALNARLLSARARPADSAHRAWRAGADAPADATGGDARYMALAAFLDPHSRRVLAAVASSDATLHIWSLALDAAASAPPRWVLVAALRLRGSSPLLTLGVIAAGGATWLAGGATDGTVTLWDISAAAAGPAPLATLGASSPHLLQLNPTVVLAGLHQSGVNSLSIAAAPASLAHACGCCDDGDDCSSAVVVLTGGDDAALTALLLHMTREERGGVRVAAATREPGAHSSGNRAVWTDGTAALSASLDQRLRLWRLEAAGGADAGADAAAAALDAPWLAAYGDAPALRAADASSIDLRAWWRGECVAGMRLAPEASCRSGVPDVEAMAALPRGPAPRAGFDVAVAGRGTQVFCATDSASGA